MSAKLASAQSQSQSRSAEQLWEWLSEVCDPEIPVLSIVDLGIVREAFWSQDTAHITITPTYSGCPATSVIRLDIETHLAQRGVKSIDVKTQLAPAWTTDWLSQAGREKLKAYGIAPPVEGTSCAGMIGHTGAASVEVECPQCASMNTERVSQFGSTPCKASYRCKDCLEPFDYFKKF